MMNTLFTPSRLIGGCAAAGTLVVAASMAMGASLSTSAFVLVLCMTPAIVMALLANNAPAPSVAQILYTVEKEHGRS
jgi:hypothetical protein